jgi:hypothetical protein
VAAEIIMSTGDPFIRAKRFHEIAQEHLGLAEAALKVEERRYYARLAEHYLLMAQGELESAVRHRDSSL